jgi:glycosyltransferase involved in cell wall biosynthesis
VTIHQIIPRSRHGDSVTDDALGLQAQIRHHGNADSNIYCLDADDTMIGVSMLPITQLTSTASENDVFIVHVQEPDGEIIEFAVGHAHRTILRPHGWTATKSERTINIVQVKHRLANMQTLRSTVDQFVGLLPVSNAVAKQLGAHWESFPRGFVIHPFFPFDDFADLTRREKQQTPTILCAGRLTPGAEIHEALIAFHLAATKYMPHAILKVVGRFSDPVYEAAIRSFAVDLRLSISFEGFVSHEQFVDLYTEASALLAPTKSSGFCVRAVEAMACGLPVVGRLSCGLGESVGENGFLLPESDSIDVMAEALAVATFNSDLRSRMQARGLRRAQELAPAVSASKFAAAMHELAGW